METSDWLEDQTDMKVVWRFAGMRPGVLSVMDCGQDLMHKWLVDSLGTHLQVTVIDLTITACMCFSNLKCEWNSCTLNLLFDTSNLLHFGFEILSYSLITYSRCSSILQCLLWPRYWPNSSRWLAVYWVWGKACGLHPWWYWKLWLLLWPSLWWCRSAMPTR